MTLCRTALPSRLDGSGEPSYDGFVRRFLTFAQDADEHAQDAGVRLGIDDNGLHLAVGRLQANVVLLLVEALQRYFAVDHGDDALAVGRFALLADDDIIAVGDVVLDHRLAAHA